MPDVTPGKQTSEFQAITITNVLTIAGAVVPPLWLMASNVAVLYPSVRWIAAAVSILSMLWNVLANLGYAKQRTALKSAALAAGKTLAVLALIVGLTAAPARAQETPAATGPLAVQVSQDFSLHLGVTVPAFGYSITNKQFLGQLTFGLNYVLDYRSVVAVGVGGGFIQTNDSPGLTAIGMLAGPVLPFKLGDSTTIRPAAIYEYKWAGGVHDQILAATMALQF